MTTLPWRISVIGAGQCGPDTAAVAERLGGLIAGRGWWLVCGGLSGVMLAACRGAKAAGGLTMGILPGLDMTAGNQFVDIPVVTGLGHMRNYLVVRNGHVCVAVAGGAGTLSEIALALKSEMPVVAIGRYADLAGVHRADSPEQAVETAAALLESAKN